MKVLRDIRPTAEQLTVIRNDPSLCIIRGCLGCGKTSTAILRLQFLISKWERRRKTQNSPEPIRVLVLTFNRTLRGYIEELVNGKVRITPSIELTLLTLSKWSRSVAIPTERILDYDDQTELVRKFATGKFLQKVEFLAEELEYVISRFDPAHFTDYLDCERVGRGSSPKCDKSFRQAFLKDIVHPYIAHKKNTKVCDWNDCFLEIINKPPKNKYDVIVCDEVQDFSANEMRAILASANQDSSITFVLDGAQRIYPRSFMWKDVGLKPTSANFNRLKENFRNTQEIAQFIAPIISKIDIGGDEGTLPNPSDCRRSGNLPILLEGKYSKQLEWIESQFINKINLSNETVAFLKPKGGGWFKEIKKMLQRRNLDFVELTRSSDWPKGGANIGLCTMHSAKGLEFDHVLILGLNQEVMPHGEGQQDTFYQILARLLAMACGRARESLIVGYKPEDASTLLGLLDQATCKKIKV